ncbi:MAG: glycosyltransferase [Olsenella sp.]|jgi:glycosyltransferase involved in cell wall biosynthesis
MGEQEKKRPLRVAFIEGKMNSGGKKTLTMQYFKNFDPDEVEVWFVCDEDSNAVPTEEIEAAGGHVVMVTPYQHIFGNMRDMRRLFEEVGFDVLHAWDSTMNLFPLRVAEKAGVPVRISESLSMAHRGEPKTVLKLILRKFSHLYATHFMACGKDCGRWQFGDRLFHAGRVDVFKTAITSERYAFNPELRARVRNELGVPEGALLLGFIGRFAYQKNPMFLMRVFREVARLRPDTRLLLIGDGEYREQMLSYAEGEGIAESLIYLGRREDIIGFYQAMDCFLLPSMYEGLPVVGLEAQVAGLDVFFSDEITREAAFCGLGHFYPLSDGAESWAKSILSVMDSVEPRSSRAEECMAAGYDAKSEARRLAAYYRRAMNEVG